MCLGLGGIHSGFGQAKSGKSAQSIFKPVGNNPEVSPVVCYFSLGQPCVEVTESSSGASGLC